MAALLILALAGCEQGWMELSQEEVSFTFDAGAPEAQTETITLALTNHHRVAMGVTERSEASGWLRYETAVDGRADGAPVVEAGATVDFFVTVSLGADHPEAASYQQDLSGEVWSCRTDSECQPEGGGEAPGVLPLLALVTVE